MNGNVCVKTPKQELEEQPALITKKWYSILSNTIEECVNNVRTRTSAV